MAITDISIPLQYIKSGTLASRPDGQFEGQIFYATDTKASYVWNGTDWQDSSVNLDNVNKLIGLNALNILDITAQASLTAGINANFERDVYSDATGYLNSVDAGNTDGLFNTNKFTNKRDFSLKNDNAHGIDLVANSTSYYAGCWFTTNKECTLIRVEKDADCNCNTITLQDTDGTTTIATATFSGNIATFNNIGLEANHKYKLVDDANRYRAYGSASFPIVLTDITINSGYHSSSKTGTSTDSSNMSNWTKIVTSEGAGIDSKVQTISQTINSGFTKFMIVANEETTGTGSVTYDITFDGTNYQTGLSSFTEYSITNTGTSLILKQNLNAGASSGTASAYNWGVLLW